MSEEPKVLTADEIRAEVIAILERAKVTFGVQYVGARKRDDWDCDAWIVSFTTGKRAEDFEYFTGLGHRRAPMNPATNKPRKNPHGSDRYAAREWDELHLRPVKPHAADVLHSIVLDSSAASQSFGDWCGELGYDTDSRKAFGIYEECQKNADKLAHVLGGAERKALAEALANY